MSGNDAAISLRPRGPALGRLRPAEAGPGLPLTPGVPDLMHFVTGRSAADIAASVERAIRTGQVSPGEQLPSVREVAERLGVNRNTVTAAYARLRDAGLVTGNGRQGSRVAGTPSVEIYRTVIPADVRDLASGNVDASLLPDLRPWLAALDLAPGGYEMVEDDPDLVRFATHAFRTDGLPAGRVAVVSGAMDGLERGLRAHLRQGDAIGIEDPGYVSALLLVRSLGLKPVPLSLDDDGVQIEALEAALAAGIRGVVLTPRAQNPTGSCMSAERAAALAAVLDRHPDVVLIEDDHAGAVSGAPPVTAAPAHPGSRPWAIIRSVSKFLGPDLRLAVMTGDAMTIARLQDQQALGPRWVSHIIQRLVMQVWSAPETTGLIERAATSYAARRERLLACLAAEGITGTARSGLHVWVPVQREAEVVQGMLARGWAIQAGEIFRLRSGPGVRIGIAGLAAGEEEAVARALADSMRPGRLLYT